MEMLEVDVLNHVNHVGLYPVVFATVYVLVRDVEPYFVVYALCQVLSEMIYVYATTAKCNMYKSFIL